jgi:hypothetical protein
VFDDPTVASVRDPAVRNLLDQTRGLITELRTRVAALENERAETWARLREVQYKEGSTFASNEAMADAIARAHKMGGEE